MPSYQEVLADNVSQATSAFNLKYTPRENTLSVYIEGIFQATSLYTLSGKQVIFASNIPAGYTVACTYEYAPGEVVHSILAPQASKSPGSLCLTISSTFVVGATATNKFLVCDIKGRNAAIPLYTFSYSVPDVDLVTPYTDMVLDKGVYVEQGTSYNAGIALNFYDGVSAVEGYDLAIPLYKVSTNNTTPTLKITEPTIVSGLTATGQFLVAQIDNQSYGIPLAYYSTVYPFTSSIVPSAANVTTKLFANPTQYDAPKGSGSTNLNSKIKTYAQAIQRIKVQIGYPFVNIEVCDDSQIVEFIDMAMEMYTKYAGYTEEYFVFSSELYEEPGLPIDKLISITPSMRATGACGLSGGYDYDLGDYRKVAGIFEFAPGESTGINTLFTLEQAMSQQTYYSYMLGNAGFDLVTWEVLKQWLDLRTKVLAQTHYVDFDENRQLLRLIPAPNKNSRFYGAVGCWVEKPIAHLIREQWIQKYALALTKIAVGNVRGKYQGMQMFGGGVLNFNDLLSQGLKEKEELEKSLQEGDWYDTSPPRFFLG
jgi:hypothetical protein